jgi:hypothetical protein
VAEFEASVEVGGDGSKYTDNDHSATGLFNGGHIIRLVPMFQNIVNIAIWVKNTAAAIVSNAGLAQSYAQNALNSANAAATSVTQINTIGATTGLQTTGAVVGTAAASPPAAKQVLRATSATSATWQTLIPTTTAILKGNNAGDVTAATVRTDYAEPTTALGTGLLKNTTSTGQHTIAAAGTDYAGISNTNIFTVVQDFAASGITLKGSSTGKSTFTSANSSATNYTITFPASTGTVLTTASVVTVAQGGTGVATLTGLVKGNGTGAFTPVQSGTDIKTINGLSLLGSGDISLESGNTQIYTSGVNSWVCPDGVTKVRVTVVGGGGTGATSDNYSNLGGYGAGTAIKFNLTVVPGTTYTATAGAAAAVRSTINGSGNSGGNSSFSGGAIATITAGGGLTESGGSASGGDLNMRGGSPSHGNTGLAQEGLGGSSFLSNPTLGAANGYGGGAGGRYVTSGNIAASSSFTATSGIVIIEW